MRLAVCALLGGLAACSPFPGGGAFQCEGDSQCTGGPGPGRCEIDRGLCSFGDGSCGSGFRYGSASGSLSNTCVGDEPIGVDAPLEDSPDGPVGPPADAPCEIGGLDLCAQQPGAPLVISGTSTLNTDSDPRCSPLPQAGGPEACLVYASSVTIEAGATLRATGGRPLVIASSDAITIAGTLDVSSQRGGGSGPNASFAMGCAPAAQAEPDPGGAAGAAGGSFRGAGGRGGTGDADNSLGGDGTATAGVPGPTLAAAPAFARGGCAGARGANEGGGGGGGQGGSGGASGGAVWLVAHTSIAVPSAGLIRATGAGGTGGAVQAGGGGAGSGGYIRIAAATLAIAGTVVANGGAGAEGGCRCNGVNVTGSPGQDGTTTGTAALGGAGASVAGDGGDSSSTAQLDGENGAPSDVGAGGGGGGAGFIVFVGTATVSGVVSPPAQ